MFFKELTSTVRQVFNNRFISITAVLVTFITAVLSFYSPVAACIIYLNYILGYILCWSLIRYKKSTTVYFQRITSFYESRSIRRILKPSCSICDDLSCRRHQQIKNAVPWKNLLIHDELNCAVEKFYNSIIENFINSWYGKFTADEDFIVQLRYCLRYASATIIIRVLEVDAAEIILNKLVPCAIKHIDDYLYMQQIVKLKNVRFNDVVVEYLGKRLHAATVNRKFEVAYLQNLVNGLMNHILPDSYLKCKNFSVLIREVLSGWVFLPLMDILADPNIINWLVVYLSNYKPKKTKHVNKPIKLVEFLHNFEVLNSKKKSSFYVGLNKTQSNTQMFYVFMQFLKKQEHVHLLQFCLDVDEFNKLLLKPELTKNQLEELHTEAIKLYKEYLDKNSVNYICCAEEISEEFHSLVKEGVHNIGKLRTSKPLFMAYEHTFSVLENIWLPQFYHSSEFFSYICGDKATSTYDKYSKRHRKYLDSSNQSTVSKISTSFGKIKGVLKANQPIEGALYPEAQNIGENGTVDDMMPSDTESINRDLSSWRISIPTYKASPTNKDIEFHINIQRLDLVPDETRRNWYVWRKEQDFFILKAKLIEFHGENELADSPLPSRKSNSSLESKKEKYETFIRRLLQKPLLRGSDLLFTFLTSMEDFTDLMVNSIPVGQELGNIYQSVAHKLRKEKGQNLDSFMNAFLNSTGKSKQGKFDWAEYCDEIDSPSLNMSRVEPFPKTYRNRIFNDNFGVSYQALKDGPSSSFNPVGITESIFYLMRFIFKLPQGILKFYAILCNISQPLIDLLCKVFVDRKLKSSLSQPNLAYLIGLLEDVVFHPHKSPTIEELEIRKEKAFKGLEEMISPFINKTLFKGNLTSGLTTILEIVQNPHYNKQLVYNLLDIILVELYPSLGDDK